MPTSQIFRSLQYANELLEGRTTQLFMQGLNRTTGMVSADVVGFHAFDHARHFLNGCKRMLGLTYHTRLVRTS
jgi:trehalose 6-phosphate synthase/phosphatase